MHNSSPIGIFDSGFGGLTVAREIVRLMPDESFIYVGDSARCPYGPRGLSEVDLFVQAIGQWLVDKGVKLIVIACNTATVAGLAHAQEVFSVPVVGVVKPGARAATRVTHNRRVGVIGTTATINSQAYTAAIRANDAGIKVFSQSTPLFVEIAERGVKLQESLPQKSFLQSSAVYLQPEFEAIAHDYLDPLRRLNIDTLVLGCTHFPILLPLISKVMGDEVSLISSAEEVAIDTLDILSRKKLLAPTSNKQPGNADLLQASIECYTTGNDCHAFRAFGSRVLGTDLKDVFHLDLDELA